MRGKEHLLLSAAVVAGPALSALGAVLAPVFADLTALGTLEVLRDWSRLRALLGGMSRLVTVLTGKLVNAGSSAVPDPVASLAAVEASNCLLLLLDGILRALPSIMTKGVTVSATRHQGLYHVAGLLETLKVLASIFGPSLTVARARATTTKAVSYRVLLSQVALEVHVGHGLLHLKLHCNQKDADIMLSKGVLEGNEVCVWKGLDVGPDGFFGVEHVIICNSLLDFGHSSGWLEVLDIGSVDLPRVLAFIDRVAPSSFQYQETQKLET